MLQTIKELQGYKIRATDRDIGKVSELYFDDKEWIARYVVVDTGGWLTGRLVLLSPSVCGRPDRATHELPVNLTKAQVANAPSVDEDKPVSRQHEVDLSTYYGWPTYWTIMSPMSPTITQVGAAPITPAAEEAAGRVNQPAVAETDPHLRSSKTVIGYKIEAHDGRIGRVEDFVIDDEKWSIDYMVVDTGGWLTGRKVILAPSWVSSLDWDSSVAHVDLQRATIESSPEFDPATIHEQE